VTARTGGTGSAATTHTALAGPAPLASAPSYDDELYALLTDREALAASLAASHERRLAVAAASEAALREAEQARCGGALRSLRCEELRRNRARLAEVHQLVASATARVEAAGLVVAVDGGGVTAAAAVPATPPRSTTSRRTAAVLGPGPILPLGPPP
jgi:hypothetical protein